MTGSAREAPASPETATASSEQSSTARRTRSLSRGKALLGLGVVAIGAVCIAPVAISGRSLSLSRLLGSSNEQYSTYKAARTELPVTLEAGGALESCKNLEVASEVEGQTTIIYIKPEGTHVQKGELVCELDSSTLRNNLTNQVIATRQAESNLQNAIKTREVAEFSLNEYIGGTYPQSLEAARDQLKLAEINLTQAISRYEWSSLMVQKGYVAESQNISDRDSKLNCEISLSNAKTRIVVLETYTRKKMLTQLEAAIVKGKSDELAKEATFGLEKSKQRKLEQQIEKCKLYAPNDGLVAYANEDMMRRGSNQTAVEEGATVRERQRIFKLPDLTQMRVNTKIHESLIDRVALGQKVRIRVDAYPGQVLDGTVDKVQPMADSGGGGQGAPTDVRVYTVLISINNSPSGLRPGMSAQAEVLVSQFSDVLTIPVKSVLQFQGKDHVYVVTRDGPKLRQVKLGSTNDKLLTVEDGLRDGDDVVLGPMSLMSDREKYEAFAVRAPHTRGEGWDEIIGQNGTNEE